MIMGPFFKIEFISTSISCSESVSSLVSLCFLAALLSRDFEAPVLPTFATPSSSAFGLTTFLPPLLLFPSEGIIFRPATGLLSAAAASWAFTVGAGAGASSAIGFCFVSPMAFSCSSWTRATRSARAFSSAMTASRASVSWRVWIAATVRW
jgi:hypothetical protein